MDADGNPAPDPPKNVVVVERSLSNYIDTSGADTLIDGGADNGLGDPVQNYDNSGGFDGYHRSSGPPPNDHSVPTRENAALLHYSVRDGSTGTITLPTRSLSCDIDCSRAAASPAPTDVMVGNYYMAAVAPPGTLVGWSINKDRPTNTSWEPLQNPLYGGSVRFTSDELKLSAGDGEPADSTYAWSVSGPGSGSYGPPSTPTWVVGPLNPVPGLLTFECLVTHPDGTAILTVYPKSRDLPTIEA